MMKQCIYYTKVYNVSSAGIFNEYIYMCHWQYMYICTYILYVFLYIYMYIYICKYVCIYIYIYMCVCLFM